MNTTPRLVFRFCNNHLLKQSLLTASSRQLPLFLNKLPAMVVCLRLLISSKPPIEWNNDTIEAMRLLQKHTVQRTNNPRTQTASNNKQLKDRLHRPQLE